jgi:putative ABC transport system permease protein
MNLVIRAPNAGDGIVPAVRGELAGLDPRLAVAEVKTMERLISERRSPQALMMWILVVFGTAALLMAAVGMYAVMAYAAAQRTHEIGVRMALGAQPGDVLKLMLGRGLKLTTIGLVIGLIGAFALAQLVRSLLYDVSPSDPATFATVIVTLTAFALFACYVPARRATKVDPLIALRGE